MRRFVCVSLCLVFAAAAATLPDRYIVQLSGEPAASVGQALQRKSRFSPAEFRNRLDAVKQQQQRTRAALEQAGVDVTGSTAAVSNTLFVHATPAQAAQLQSMPGVARVYPVRLHKPVLDHALPLMKVPDAWNQIGGMSNAGAGIKIGIIDTGIDVNHPGFNDPSLQVPAGFPKTNQDSDTQYTNNKIIVARSYTHTPQRAYNANDVDGHGTGVAMVAAGVTNTGPFGTITGVAPKAFLGNYKVFPDGLNGAPDDLILQGINDAVTDGMDVINLSLGSNPAPRPQDDVLVGAIENAVAAGVIVTVAAGNDGANPNTVSSPGIAPDAITAGSTWNDRILAGSVQAAGASAQVAIPGDGPNSRTPITASLQDVANVDPTGLACGSLPAASLNGSIALILRGTCTFETKINNVQQAGAVAALIYTDAARPNAIPMATGSATLPAEMVDYSVGMALKQQLASGSLTMTMDFSLAARFVDPNRLSDFSAAGPNTDGGIKPDVVAVGSNISTAEPVSQGSYVVESGTSFSSPMMAGAAALLKAARPGLTIQQYRSLLIDTASPLVFSSGSTAGSQQAGGGLLNMLSAINGTVAANPVSISFGMGGSTINQTQKLTITNVGTASDTYSLQVMPASGSTSPALSTNTVQLDPGQSQDVSVQLTASGLAAGAYQGVIQIQGSQSGTATAVPYWYGIGSGVAKYITVLEPPTSGNRGSRQTVFFRITDAIGVPITADANVTVTTGNGSVSRVDSADSDYPGVYAMVVRISAGTNVFHIAVGDISADVTIQGQ